MATTASDTGNQFADAWNSDQWAAARQAVRTQAVAPSADASSELNQYRAAWDAENHGVYGDIGTEQPLQNAVAASPAANPFTQGSPRWITQQPGTNVGFKAPNAVMYDSSIDYKPGAENYTGGYGSWRYGSAAPEAGTDAWNDYQSYWDNGGYDLANLYGRREQTLGTLRSQGRTVVDTGATPNPGNQP